jgi:hypothetical protein
LAVSAIEAVDDFPLCVRFSDGETAVVDLAGLGFRSGQFTAIRTPAAFANARIEDGSIACRAIERDPLAPTAHLKSRWMRHAVAK